MEKAELMDAEGIKIKREMDRWVMNELEGGLSKMDGWIEQTDGGTIRRVKLMDGHD